MLKNNSYRSISCTYILLAFLFFFTTCKRQEKPKQVTKNLLIDSLFSFPLKQNPDPAAQIGDYFPDILQDKKGTIWFATAFKGAAKLDGDALTHFTLSEGLPSLTILDLTEDRAGNIWLATRNGVAKYDGKSFHLYKKTDGLLSNWTSCIFADREGNIWVGTREGVSRFDGKSFSTFHLPKPSDLFNSDDYQEQVIRITEDKKGNIWFGTKGYGACKFDGKTFFHFTKKDGLSSNSVKSILEDRQGNIWFGSLETEIPSKLITNSYDYLEDGGLSRYDGNKITTFPEIESLTGHEVWDICEDKNGNIWIAPKNRGLVLFDGQKFTTVPGSMDLTEHSCVQSILEDREGQMWFGYSGGVFRLEGVLFVNVMK